MPAGGAGPRRREGCPSPPFRPPSPAGAELVLSEEMSAEEFSGGEPGGWTGAA